MDIPNTKESQNREHLFKREKREGNQKTHSTDAQDYKIKKKLRTVLALTFIFYKEHPFVLPHKSHEAYQVQVSEVYQVHLQNQGPCNPYLFEEAGHY